jgi:hypothetical protein
MECGGKRSATPLWIKFKMEFNKSNPKRRRRMIAALDLS